MKARRAIGVVARREISERLRQKSFLVSSAITLVIVVAVAIVPALFGSEGPDRYAVAALDDAAKPTVAAAAAVGRQFDARIEVKRFPNVAAARKALGDDELDALVIGRVVETADTPDDALAQTLQAANRRLTQADALRRAGLSDAEAARALDPPLLQVRPQKAADEGREARSAFAFVAVIVLYGQLLTFGFWVASGVVEEKTSRVVEVVLSTIRPTQLLAGKVIGIGLLGLGQLLLVTVVGVAAGAAAGTLSFSQDIAVAALLALVWFVLGYAFYSCAFACAGAIVPRQEELQSSSSPLTIVILISFFVAFQAIQDPTGVLATVSSFLPMTAPMTMPPRIALGEAPVWQILAAIAVTAGSALALIPVAARIYSGAVLRTGSAIKLRDAWRSAGR